MKPRKLTKKRSRQLLPSPGDLFAQPPAAFYRLPEFGLRGSSLLTRGCRRVLEFDPGKDMPGHGQFYSNILWRGAANRIPDRKKPDPDRQNPPHRLCQQVG